MRVPGVVGAVLAGGGALALVGLMPAAASAAAAPPKPSASCKVPVLSVTPLTVTPGSKVMVSGVNFSGCPAQGSKAKPTPVLTVKIAVVSAAKTGKVLATTTTSRTGVFSVRVTVPALPSGGVPKLALVAQSRDAATGLDYVGLAVLAYKSVAKTPAPVAAPVKHITPVAPAPSGGGGVPTAVPAGSGGLAAATSPVTRDAELALGGAGLVLLAAGGVGLGRRRQSGRR